MKNKNYLLALLLLFFLGLFYGSFISKNALKDTRMQYATTLIENKSGKEVTFYVQRYDDKTFQVTNSQGMVYISKLDKALADENTLTIELPGHIGKFSLQGSIQPWGQANLSLIRSDLYSQKENSSENQQVAQIHNLKESNLSSEDTGKNLKTLKLNLTKQNIESIISDFGKWLFFSSYAEEAIVVREPFDQYRLPSLENNQALEVTTKNYNILTRIIGNQESQIEDIKAEKAYNLTLLGNNLASSSIDDFQSSASFRLYHLPTKVHKYYANTGSEAGELLGNSQNYQNYYQTTVDSKKTSYQIILGTNGTVYLQDKFQPNTSSELPKFKEAPQDMQDAYHKLLEKFSSEKEQ